MKVVVAIDSFKGSITSMQAAMAAKRGILAAKPDSLESIDRGMANYAHVAEEYLRKRALSGDCSSYDFSDIPGAGAAGGLGFAFLSFLNAELVPGAELILDAIGIEEDIKDADVVVTGEGRLDNQTAMGKAPAVVAKLAKKYGAKVIAFAGSVATDIVTLNYFGFDACFPIMREPHTLEDAMKPENAMASLEAMAEQAFRLL